MITIDTCTVNAQLDKGFGRILSYRLKVRPKVPSTDAKENGISIVQMTVRQLGGTEFKENNTVRVNIRLKGKRIRLSHANQLGSHPEKRARRLLTSFSALPLRLDGGKAKVTNFNGEIIVQEYVYQVREFSIKCLDAE